jgi:hydrogen peroxide-dependent heme synthase
MHSFDQFPPVPLTLEGAALLHQMLKIKWPQWRALAASRRAEVVAEASAALAGMEGQGSAAFSMLGHKGDLMLVHFRPDFDALGEAQRALPKLALWDFVEVATSYLSVVELGLYESTMKVYAELAEKSVAAHSPEWDTAIEETLMRQRVAMKPRLFPEIPPAKFICFYPMDRRRGEEKNWYQLTIAERQRQMAEHGEVGRRYAGKVRQIISGSIGFDDWEWGVDLFAEDPVVFKHLIYEMRFDEVSAVYALFGTFFVGQRLKPAELRTLLAI